MSFPRASRVSFFPIQSRIEFDGDYPATYIADRPKTYIRFVRVPSSILSEILRRSNPSLPYRASQFLTQDEGSKLEERIRTSFLLPSFSPLSFSPFLYFLYNPDGFIEKPPTLSAVRETGYKLRAKTQYGRSTFGVIHF